jgi:uncharacterized RDD family membrane protein YckC
MTAQQTYPSASDIYGGFWIRFGSLWLDFLILLPAVALIQFLSGLNKPLYYTLLLPNFILLLFIHIYCVKRWGGTPGKLILGLKIVKDNGENVNWESAILRHIVMLAISVFGMWITAVSVAQIDNQTYGMLGFVERSLAVSQVDPFMFSVYTWLSNIWIYSEFVTLLTNRKRKAIHDYMAGTVVIRGKYQSTLVTNTL